MVSWQDQFEQIGDVRGLGAMLALELVESRETKEPNPKLATAIIEAAAERGHSCPSRASTRTSCIRVPCPLVVTDAELDEALDVWEETR